jgi:hypothetical protein
MQRIIRVLIDFLTSLNRRLERAYFDTYADTGAEADITNEFYQDLSRRKAMNKGRVVVELGKCAAQDILKKDNYLIGIEAAITIGERLFNEAQKAGDIDELNNLIERKDNNDDKV